jgi:hypothetical protein
VTVLSPPVNEDIPLGLRFAFRMMPAWLVIVVASWACSVVSQVEASSAKDGSLAELREKFLNKLKEDSTGPGGHSLHSLQEMASALLQSDSDPYNLSLQTPVMYQLVNLTRELDEQLSAQLLIQHQAAEAALNNFSGWADCNRSRDECLAGPTTSSPQTTTTRTTGVASSTSTTMVTTTTSTTTCPSDSPCCEMRNCTDEEDEVRFHMNYACSELARENRSVEDVKNERCNETWAATYEDYLERDIEKLATLQLLHENCTNWTQRWLNQTGVCGERAIQCETYVKDQIVELNSSVERENLTISYLRYECCFGNASYDSCMGSAAITWQDEVNSQLILAESRQTEWRAIKRIMCLSDVLLMNASQDQRGALEACIAASYNASHLVLDLQSKPSPLECDNQTFVPSGW